MSARIRRRTISFDASTLAGAERLSRQRGESLSAFVNAAVEHHLKVAHRQKVAAGRKLMEEDDERWGPIPEQAIAEIEALWPE